ncbi:MAG: hypothetical protein AB1571_01335 [Nanoarchaeota archaeon]
MVPKMLRSVKKGLSGLLMFTLLSSPVSYAFAGEKADSKQQETKVSQPINKRLESKKKDLESILKTIKKYEVSIFSGAITFSYEHDKLHLKLVPPYKNPNEQDKRVSFNYQLKNLYNSFHNLISDGREIESQFDKWFFEALYNYVKQESKKSIPKNMVVRENCSKLTYISGKKEGIEEGTEEGIYFLKDKNTKESCGFPVFSDSIVSHAEKNPNTFFKDYSKVIGDPKKSDRSFEAIFRPGSTITLKASPLVDIISKQKLESVVRTFPQPTPEEKEAPSFIPVEPLPEEKQKEYPVQPSEKITEETPMEKEETDNPPEIKSIKIARGCPRENERINVGVVVVDEERDNLYAGLSLSIGNLDNFNKFVGQPETHNFDIIDVRFPQNYKELNVLFKSKNPLKKISDLENDIVMEAYAIESKNPEKNNKKTEILYNPFKECKGIKGVKPELPKEQLSQEEKQKELVAVEVPKGPQPAEQEKPKSDYVAVELPTEKPAPTKEESEPSVKYGPLTPDSEKTKEPKPKKQAQDIPVTQPSDGKTKEGKKESEKRAEKKDKGVYRPYISTLEIGNVAKNIYEIYSQPIGLNVDSRINLNLFGVNAKESLRLGRFYESVSFTYLDGNKASLHGKTSNPASRLNGTFNAIEKELNAEARLLLYNKNNITVSPGMQYNTLESRTNGNAALDIGGEASLSNKTIDTIYSAGLDVLSKGKPGYSIGFDVSYKKQNNRNGLDLEGPAYKIKLGSQGEIGKLYLDFGGYVELANLGFTDFKRTDNIYDLHTSASYSPSKHLELGVKYGLIAGNSKQKYSDKTQFKTKTIENSGGIFLKIK